MKMASLVSAAFIASAFAVDESSEKKLEADYAEMRKLYPTASELLKEHPTHQLWAKRKADLVAANYITKADLKVGRKFADKKQANLFFQDALRMFPGIEMRFSGMPGGDYFLIVWASGPDMKALKALAVAE